MVFGKKLTNLGVIMVNNRVGVGSWGLKKFEDPSLNLGDREKHLPNN